MNMPGFLSAAYNTTANAASNVYGFSKDLFGKGYTVCSSLANRVSQVAGRFIPEAVSNTVKAHPMKFACAGSAIVGGVAVLAVSQIFFRGTPPPRRNNSV